MQTPGESTQLDPLLVNKIVTVVAAVAAGLLSVQVAARLGDADRLMWSYAAGGGVLARTITVGTVVAAAGFLATAALVFWRLDWARRVGLSTAGTGLMVAVGLLVYVLGRPAPMVLFPSGRIGSYALASAFLSVALSLLLWRANRRPASHDWRPRRLTRPAEVTLVAVFAAALLVTGDTLIDEDNTRRLGNRSDIEGVFLPVEDPCVLPDLERWYAVVGTDAAVEVAYGAESFGTIETARWLSTCLVSTGTRLGPFDPTRRPVEALATLAVEVEIRARDSENTLDCPIVDQGSGLAYKLCDYRDVDQMITQIYASNLALNCEVFSSQIERSELARELVTELCRSAFETIEDQQDVATNR